MRDSRVRKDSLVTEKSESLRESQVSQRVAGDERGRGRERPGTREGGDECPAV